jgi:hypothetical protein
MESTHCEAPPARRSPVEKATTSLPGRRSRRERPPQAGCLGQGHHPRLDRQVLPDGRAIEFSVDGFAKQCMLEGVDELGYILLQEASIAAFEAKRAASINTPAPARTL